MNYFFILGHGRSGSNFLANLLNKYSLNSKVLHEPYNQDYQLLALGYYMNDSFLLKKMLDKRFEILHSGLHQNIENYGEVNSLLRYNIEYLIKNFGKNIFHLVRDGRDVVRSTYVRSTYTPNDSHLSIFPKNDDIYVSNWLEFSRFQKICWYWNETNTYLLKYNIPIIQFEKIIREYSFFKENLLDKINIDICYEKWRSEVEIPRNRTNEFSFKKFIRKHFFNNNRISAINHWSYWSDEQKEQFEEICGKTMKLLGYKIEW